MNQSNENALIITKTNNILNRTPRSAFSIYSRAHKEFQSDAGRPLIIDYKFSNNLPDIINIELTYKYRWLDTPQQVISLQLPFPSQYKKPFMQPRFDFIPEQSNTLLLDMMTFCLEHLLQQRQSWESILREAESSTSMERHYIQLYFKAYALANTDNERIRIIESLINRYGYYAIYLKSSPGLEHQAVHAQNSMKHYLNTLPSCYVNHSETAQNIHKNYTEIFILLSQQKIHDAWRLFDPHTPLSPFIQNAFPYLQATKHTLHVLFRICGLEKHYGPDSILYIPEHDVIVSIKTHLEKALSLITNDSRITHFIREKALEPIEYLLDTGHQHTQETPVSDIFHHCREEVRATRQHIFNHGSIPSARVNQARVANGPIIEEISETNISTLLLK